jgi:hypothetical protein
VKRWLVFSVVLALVSVGCGSNPASPASENPASSNAASGATINGAIVSSGSAGASISSVHALARPQAMAGLVVTIAGTNISATVDQSDRFVLRGVPAGNVQLQFSAPALTASLGLNDVQSAETIALSISVASPTSVVLESQRRSLGSEEQLEGRVESLPPAVSPLTLVVAGRNVTTNAQTKFFLRGGSATFADLVVGQRVHVKGQASGGSLVASSVDIQNTNEDIPVEINGTVQAFSGPVSGFQFTIDGRLIRGDATTEFFGGSQFSQLVNGVRAEVKGLQRNGFVFATRIHVNVPDDSGGGDQSASIEGPLTSKTGSVPQLTLVVAGTTVLTSASTDVRRRGDVQTLDVLALGMTLHVVGDRQPNGSLNARMIQIKDDATGGQVEISGSAGGVKGSCPALTFGVNGFDIVTDGTTTFTPNCAAIRNGAKVTVKGVVQAGGSIKATSVALQ